MVHLPTDLDDAYHSARQCLVSVDTLHMMIRETTSPITTDEDQCWLAQYGCDALSDLLATVEDGADKISPVELELATVFDSPSRIGNAAYGSWHVAAHGVASCALEWTWRCADMKGRRDNHLRLDVIQPKWNNLCRDILCSSTATDSIDDEVFVMLGKEAVRAARMRGDTLVENCGPRWDRDDRTLTYQGVVVKTFRKPAGNQFTVLDVFEESEWPSEIDDPLSPNTVDPQSRVQETVKSLNDLRRSPIMSFATNGKGTGFTWRAKR